jgi:hypothetical protein
MSKMERILVLVCVIMIRLLIAGLFVVIAVLGWLLTSSSDIQISTSVKSASKNISQESSPVTAPDQAPSGKSLAADLRSVENHGLSSPSAKQSISFQSGVNSTPTLNIASTLPSTAASAGSSSSTGGSGSTATSYDSSSTASSGRVDGVPIREIAIPVPVGAKVPALFQDDTPKPPQQMRALDRIASEFEQNVSEIPAGMTQEEVWEAARLIADERYMTLFGYQAYNQYHIKAAKEALKEKRTGAPDTKGP